MLDNSHLRMVHETARFSWSISLQKGQDTSNRHRSTSISLDFCLQSNADISQEAAKCIVLASFVQSHLFLTVPKQITCMHAVGLILFIISGTHNALLRH